MALRIAVVGAQGRMGKSLQQVISSDLDCELSALIDRHRPLNKVDSDKVDGVIDFSTTENLNSVLRWCEDYQKPLVVGTTGFVQSPPAQLERSAKKIPVLWSANMSLGVAFVTQAIRHFQRLQHFDFQIEEVHHKQKKDMPSGTAVSLQQDLEKTVGRVLPKPLCIRAASIFGIHRVLAFGPDEMITIEHQALNRNAFSQGSILALKWLVTRPPGFYTLIDIFEKQTQE